MIAVLKARLDDPMELIEPQQGVIRANTVSTAAPTRRIPAVANRGGRSQAA
ncbi:hypothetical protein PC116_g18675 [Phytophthora cactorum]|nr:hypothetical protein Pcac1_g19008 [Phytophthora cactorum]KAG2974911.1 hypothetical protein PC119_g22559 [Phytophthora cactorum]KAG3151629.1 hypothetical protein C6341_g16503 [Phytophthora cactorum]KAG3183289.1 hypothetical protein PC128_g14263 [Phytophthora cactorum]KAG4233104.1 hypothetical protein PC116_g18675 [Phytophthora cactorum]